MMHHYRLSSLVLLTVFSLSRPILFAQSADQPQSGDTRVNNANTEKEKVFVPEGRFFYVLNDDSRGTISALSGDPKNIIGSRAEDIISISILHSEEWDTNELCLLLKRIPSLKSLSFFYRESFSLSDHNQVWELLPELEELRVIRGVVDESSLTEISKNIRSLKSIELRLVDNTSQAIRLIAKYFPDLEKLSVNSQMMSSESVVPISTMIRLRELVVISEGLKLRSSDTTSWGAFKDLESLDLDLDIDDQGLQFVENFPKLSRLSVRSGNVTGEFLVNLAAPKKLTSLWLLSAGRKATKITDASLKHMKELTELKYLTVRSSKVTGEGLRHLEKLHSLNSLGMMNCAFKTKYAYLLLKLPSLEGFNIESPRFYCSQPGCHKGYYVMGTMRSLSLHPNLKSLSWDAEHKYLEELHRLMPYTYITNSDVSIILQPTVYPQW